MKKAYVFPGQGAQFPGMAKDLFEQNESLRPLFMQASEIVGYDLPKIMFEGSEEELKQTKVTQPAIFLHSVAKAFSLGEAFRPDMVAGHSLGEFSALVAAGAMDFKDGMTLVLKRALAMQKACELQPSTMAAVLGLEDSVVEEICASVDGVVVAANYNCPGQLVISGSVPSVEAACEKMKAAGAKRALLLPVGGAFHSPLMEPARVDLEKAILETEIKSPVCPIYQNYTASASTDVDTIRKNLALQLTGPVRWTQSVQNMVADGAGRFTELGPGKVLQGLIQKIFREAVIEAD